VPPTDALSWSYPAVTESVPLARHRVRCAAVAAGATGEVLESVALCASEAVTNVVRHAYDESNGEIHIWIRVRPRQFTVIVADDGHGLRESSDPGLGLGLGLMDSLSDELLLTERPGGGLEASMTFGTSTT
jgi:anti-sigma regulatory factor (Ser/Thr protein kinase)